MAPAAFPGTNGLITFESQAFNQNNDQEIFVVRPDGTGQSQITNNITVDDADPTFSPDGRTIVFSRDITGLNRIEGAGDGDLFLIDVVENPDGTFRGVNERQLTGAAPGEINDDFDPFFSPDGQRVIFIRDGDIFTVNVDGTGERQITNNNAFEFNPSFSPTDPNVITFSRFVIDPGQNQGDDEIFTLNLATGEETRLTDNTFSDRFTEFSPDGSRIAFESDRGGDRELFIINADGTGLRQVTDNAVDDFFPSFSPDGRLLTFARNQNGMFDIFTLDLATGEERQVSQGVPGAFDPNFGPRPAVQPQPPAPQPPAPQPPAMQPPAMQPPASRPPAARPQPRPQPSAGERPSRPVRGRLITREETVVGETRQTSSLRSRSSAEASVSEERPRVEARASTRAARASARAAQASAGETRVRNLDFAPIEEASPARVENVDREPVARGETGPQAGAGTQQDAGPQTGAGTQAGAGTQTGAGTQIGAGPQAVSGDLTEPDAQEVSRGDVTVAKEGGRLPDTGGTPFAPLAAALALGAGLLKGLLAARRRRS